MRAKYVSIIIIAFMVLTLLPCGSSESYAATSGGDKMAAYASSCVGKSKSQVGLGSSGEWCAAFVKKCADKSGNGSLVGSNGYVISQAVQTVNKKGGKITFVNKTVYDSDKQFFSSARCSYNSKYTPQKGDLMIINIGNYRWKDFGQYTGHYAFSHVGIVVQANSTFDIYTVEGNTSCNCGKHSDYTHVEKKHRKGGISGYKIVAYVTPKYSTSKTVSKSSSGTASSGASKVVSNVVTNVESSGSSNVVSYGWPTASRTITGHWGLESGHARPYHYGIDIGAAGGSKVYAAADGIVIGAGLFGGYGYCVRIKHSNGQVTLYGHNSKLAVVKNQTVKKGQVIAYVGGTGSGGKVVYANHLHFGIYLNESALNKEGAKASAITIDPEKALKNSSTTSSTSKPATTTPKPTSTSSTTNKSTSSSQTQNSTQPSTQGQTADGKIVTQDVYNSKYKNNSKYKCTKVYKYSTRSKSTTTSGYDSLDGYTKYDTKTSTSYSGYKLGSPCSTSTSYSGNKKVTTSAVNVGYYYYAYAAANPTSTSDWSFVCGKSRSGVISYMKSNYSASSAWSEQNLRYFWLISTNDLGSVIKGSQVTKISTSIPYCDNSNVSVGTLTKTGYHYYDIPMYRYSKCYKLKYVTTVNYFYKWSGWSSWSDWVTNPPSASDSVKISSDVRYLVRAK